MLQEARNYIYVAHQLLTRPLAYMVSGTNGTHWLFLGGINVWPQCPSLNTVPCLSHSLPLEEILYSVPPELRHDLSQVIRDGLLSNLLLAHPPPQTQPQGEKKVRRKCRPGGWPVRLAWGRWFPYCQWEYKLTGTFGETAHQYAETAIKYM